MPSIVIVYSVLLLLFALHIFILLRKETIMTENTNSIILASEVEASKEALKNAPLAVKSRVAEAGMFASVNEPDEFRRKALTYNATQEALPMRSLIDSGEVIKPMGVIVRVDQIEQEQEDGSIVIENVPCVIIIDDNGVAYMSHSAMILNSVAALITTYGADVADWPEGIRLSVIEVRSNKGRLFHRLKIVF